MIRIGIILLMFLGVSSCYKENPQPKEEKPIIVYPYVTDSITDSIPTLAGQTWVVTGVRIGGIGNPTTTNDTLVFLNKTTYKYNGISSGYSLYYTGGGFNLSMKGTPWGYLSGTIYDYNLINGTIQGLKFTDITAGSTNNVNYYIWMDKIN